MKEGLSIAEVSQQFDISATTLRYYERIGLMDPVKKNGSGHRYYTEHDLRRIRFIKCMRTSGMTVEQIKKYVDLFHEGEQTIPQRKELLIEQLANLNQQVDELKTVIHYLENKIDNYEETLVKRELQQRHHQ